MRKLIFALSFICTISTINAQIIVQKIPDENLCVIDAKLMQSGYSLAFSNMTSETYLFKGKEDEWKKCWISLMHDLNNFMHKKGLKLNATTTCFNRIYFDKEGKITAYLYHFNGFTKEQEQKFDESIFEFLIAQKVNIKANENYWQYGTLKFEEIKN